MSRVLTMTAMVPAPLRLLWQVYAIELRKTFAYRTDFWFRFLGVLLAQLAIAYFLWDAIFQYNSASAIGGYTFQGMMFYYLLVPLVENMIRNAEFGTIASDIYQGSLTRYLLYPVSFFPYKYATSLATPTIALAQLVLIGTGYGLIAGFPADVQISITSIGMFALTVIAASLMNFALYAAVEMVAFWADNIWSLNVMVMFCTRLLGGAMLPLTLFPEALQRWLQYTPFPYIISFPIRVLCGQVSVPEWLTGLAVITAWGVTFALADRVIWRRGSHNYTGVGI